MSRRTKCWGGGGVQQPPFGDASDVSKVDDEVESGLDSLTLSSSLVFVDPLIQLQMSLEQAALTSMCCCYGSYRATSFRSGFEKFISTLVS